MVWNIIDSIRRLECRYHQRYGKRGTIVCLDANAEARLAAYIMYELAHHKCSMIADTYSIKEVLENGIRSMKMVIYGMGVRFDCPSFCISRDG